MVTAGGTAFPMHGLCFSRVGDVAFLLRKPARPLRPGDASRPTSGRGRAIHC